jgi:hypothetical protein
MNMSSKTYGDELEIIKMAYSPAFSINVEVFKAAEGYKSFATNSLVHHDDLTGYGVHEHKKESLKQAVRHLRELMKEISQMRQREE